MPTGTHLELDGFPAVGRSFGTWLRDAIGRLCTIELPVDAEALFEKSGADHADEGPVPLAGKGSEIGACFSTAVPGRRCALALASALLAFASACATARSAPPPAPLSSQAVVLETPIDIQDELYECGLISISALCGYYGLTIPEPQRLALVKTAADEKGLSGAQMRDALKSVGLEVFVFRGTLDHSETGLQHHIDARRPLIVMTSQGDMNHYSLLIGYDPQYQNLVLLDPRRGRVVLPEATFDGLWANAQRFTLLAVPPGPVHANTPEPLDPKAETL